MITLFENLFDRGVINLPSGADGIFFLRSQHVRITLDILFGLEVYRKGHI